MASSENEADCICCGHLGLFSLTNNLTEFQFPRIKRKFSKSCKTSANKTSHNGEKAKTKTSYNLGNGIFTNDSNEAIVKFCKREFPPILTYKSKQHDVIFIPDVFLGGGVIPKAVVDLSGRSELEPEKQKHLQKYDGDIAGKLVEEKFYIKLRSAFVKLKITNTIVISGWEVKGGKHVTSREFDFLIICHQLKTIFQIESKKTLTSSSQEKAFEQLEKGQHFFNSIIPFLSENGWSYGRVLYYEDDATEKAPTCCDSCSQYFISKDTDLVQWWKSLSEHKPMGQPNKNDETYLNLIKYIFHQMYQQGDCITPTDVLTNCEETIDAMSSLENIFFWSDIQLSCLRESVETKRIAFMSPFGTGKTTLLKERAKRLLRKGDKVVFIIFCDEESKDESFLFQTYKEEFSNFKSLVQFYHIPNSGPTISKDVMQVIHENLSANFFFDEVYLKSGGGLSSNDLVNINQDLPKTSYLWIAFQSENPPDESLLEGFVIPKMKHPLRYSSNILQVTGAIRDIEGGTCFPPPNINPNVYLNRGMKSLFFSLQKDTSLACAVDQLAFVLEGERAKTLVKIDFEKESIVNEFLKSSVKDRIMFPKDYKEFSDPSNGEKIMILSSRDNCLIRGFEVPILVHFTNGIEGDQVEAIYSRCKSKLIIICNEKHAKKVVSANPDCNFANIIRVYGELMPKNFEQSIMDDNLEETAALLNNPRRPLPVDSRNLASQTGLMIACKYGASKYVEKFLRMHADLDAVDANSWAPIHFASAHGDADIQKKLINAIIERRKDKVLIKQSLHIKTKNGEKAIHLAAERGHNTVLEILVGSKYFHVDDTGESTDDEGDENTDDEDDENTGDEDENTGDEDENTDDKDEDSEEKDENTDDKDEGSEESDDDTDKGQTGSKWSSEHCDRKSGKTALLLACENNHLSTVQCIIQLGASPTQKYLGYYDEEWTNCLHIAALHGYTEIVELMITQNRLLIDVRTDPDDTWETNDKLGFTALHLACKENNLSIVQCLVKLGASTRQKCRDEDHWMNCLHIASANGHSEIVDYLITQNKLQIDDRTYPNEIPEEWLDCAHIGSLRGYSRIQIIQGRPKINVPKDVDNKQKMFGYTALQLACINNNLPVVKILLASGADPNLLGFNFTGPENDDAWMSSLQIAAENNCLDIAKELISGGADVNFHNEIGRTALHYSPQRGYLNIVKYLIEECHLDPNEKDGNGLTTLHHASKCCNSAIAKYLIEECHLDPNDTDNKGLTSLHHACQEMRSGVIQYLLTEINKMDVNAKTNDGSTPLHLFCERKSQVIGSDDLECVKCLVEENKADINLLNNVGEKPIDVARRSNLSTLVVYLESIDLSCETFTSPPLPRLQFWTSRNSYSSTFRNWPK